ncbi:MAG: nucleotide exchange factor GrpE [Methanomicrobiales archaeon]|nr:nucleotide exchange factor GrpE [Methanomicrobiales archaeon]
MADPQPDQETASPAASEPAPAGQPPATDSAVADLQRSYDELRDRYLRLAADYDNYRKRAVRENEAAIRERVERFTCDLLEGMDNLDRALQSDGTMLREGLEEIRKVFTASFARHGIRPVECRGLPFNPREHEAVASLPSEEPEGTVIQEVSRGYAMEDRIIRFAKVIVSKGKEKEIQ